MVARPGPNRQHLHESRRASALVPRVLEIVAAPLGFTRLRRCSGFGLRRLKSHLWQTQQGSAPRRLGIIGVTGMAELVRTGPGITRDL